MDRIDQGDLYERAHAIAKKQQGKPYQEAYEGALLRLQRSSPVIDILQQQDIPPFIGPMKQRGFFVLIREEAPGFVSRIEEVAGKPLDTGTLLYPCGFGEYVDRLKAVMQYWEVLMYYGIKSEVIYLPNPGTEEDMVALYIPLFRS